MNIIQNTERTLSLWHFRHFCSVSSDKQTIHFHIFTKLRSKSAGLQWQGRIEAAQFVPENKPCQRHVGFRHKGRQ